MEIGLPPGYAGLAPLDRDKHRGLGPRAEGPHRFATALNAIPLTAVEYFRAARDYPIAFTRSGEGRVHSGAVTGLTGGENLYCGEDGRWREGVYVPAYVRRYPFYAVDIARDDGGPDRLVCVDESGLERSRSPLFGRDGAPTAAWSAAQKLIDEMEGAERTTEAFCRRLDDLDLLEPFDVQALPVSGSPFELKGLLRVGEEKLNLLDGTAVKSMMEAGELSRIYAHLMSLENFTRLLDLAGAG